MKINHLKVAPLAAALLLLAACDSQSQDAATPAAPVAEAKILHVYN